MFFQVLKFKGRKFLELNNDNNILIQFDLYQGWSLAETFWLLKFIICLNHQTNYESCTNQ